MAAEAATLLEKMYIMLCHASENYLFNTEEPFNSVRIEQTDYFSKVVALKRNASPSITWVREVIKLLVKTEVDNQTSKESLIEVILEYLNTAPLKERALECCTQLREETKNSLPKKRSGSWQSDYEKEQQLEKLQLLTFFLHIRLNEYEAAIRSFKQQRHGNVRNEEVEIYILLKHLYQLGLKEYWIKEYEAALIQEVKPREQLQRVYQHLTQHGEFPQSYYY